MTIYDKLDTLVNMFVNTSRGGSDRDPDSFEALWQHGPMTIEQSLLPGVFRTSPTISTSLQQAHMQYDSVDIGREPHLMPAQALPSASSSRASTTPAATQIPPTKGISSSNSKFRQQCRQTNPRRMQRPSISATTPSWPISCEGPP